MSSKKLINLSIPHIIAIVIFYVVTTVFFSPMILKNKELNQQDIRQGVGMRKQLDDYRAKHEDNPMWNMSVFGGMPAYILGSTYASKSLNGNVIKAVALFMKVPANIVFLSMLFMYILMISLRTNPYVGILCALAFGLTTFNIISIEAGHNAKIRAVAMIPLVFAGINYLFSGKKMIGLATTALGFTWLIFTGHFQIVYYTGILLLIYFVVKGVFALLEKNLKHFLIVSAMVFGCGVLGILANLGSIWTSQEYMPYSIRGTYLLTAEDTDKRGGEGLDKGYVFEYQNDKDEFMTFLIPHYYGGGFRVNLKDKKVQEYETYNQLRGVFGPESAKAITQSSLYYGTQNGTAGPFYVGIIMIALFVLGFFVLDKKTLIWVSVAFVFFLMITWGANAETFSDVMFNNFPLYNKFRAVSMANIIPIFLVVMAGGLALDKLLQMQDRQEAFKKLLYGFGATAGILVLVYIASGSFDYSKAGDEARFANYYNSYAQQMAQQGMSPQIPQGAFVQQGVDNIRADRETLLGQDTLRSLFFLILGFGAFFAWKARAINKDLAVGGLALLLLIDLFVVNKMYFGEDSYQNKRSTTVYPDQLDSQILQNETTANDQHYRVLDVSRSPFASAEASYFHRSMGGYDPAKMRRIQDLYEYYIQPTLMGKAENQEGFTNVLKMYDVKYIKTGQGIMPNEGLGAAWFVKNIKEVKSDDEAIQAIAETDVATTAIVNTKDFPKVDTKGMSKGKVELVEYSNNKIKYSTENTEKGFLVISENYYPKGWRAVLDGEKELSIVRANYSLRAVEIPAGKHELTLTFEPKSYLVGGSIGLTVSILVLLFAAGTYGWEIKKTMKEEA